MVMRNIIKKNVTHPAKVVRVSRLGWIGNRNTRMTTHTSRRMWRGRF